MSIQIKLISSLEKCFTDEHLADKKKLSFASCLRGEDFHFTLAYTSENRSGRLTNYAGLICRSELAVTFERIEHVPVRIPCYPMRSDGNYLRKKAGLYPDLLVPMAEGETISIVDGLLYSVYGTVKIPEDIKAGDYTITVGLLSEAGEELTQTLTLRVLDAILPKQELLVSQWVHYDCIADAHDMEIFSEEHWNAIEAYLKVAVENGINTILTPVFTPPLDTAVGAERPTVQLVDVEKTADGYQFGFEKFRRFVELCEKLGVARFEISHLFTQWGAYHAPKIMAHENGEYKRIFGWETDSVSEEYTAFLRAFLKAFLEEAKALGIDRKLMFHVSDEPNEKHLEQYRKVKSSIADLLEGYPIYDALSNIEFYEQGIVDHPIPANDHIEPFLEADIPNLWTYYCCAQCLDVSNRFIDMSLSRTRIIGLQFWKYQIAGFLHWGYNFYYSQFSRRKLNPYLFTDGDGFVPAGDTYSVYPAPDGTPYRSLRLVAFHEAIEDLGLLRVAEKLCGREAVLTVIEQEGEITFSSYPREHDFILRVRETLCQMIEKANI